MKSNPNLLSFTNKHTFLITTTMKNEPNQCMNILVLKILCIRLYLMEEVGEEETRRGWYGFLSGLDRKTLLVVLKMVWETKWGVGLEDLEVLGAEGLSIEAFSSWASMAVVVVILLAWFYLGVKEREKINVLRMRSNVLFIVHLIAPPCLLTQPLFWNPCDCTRAKNKNKNCRTNLVKFNTATYNLKNRSTIIW